MIKFANLLFFISSFNAFAFASQPAVGSAEWCNIHQICNDPADGPTEGSDEWQKAQIKKKT